MMGYSRLVSVDEADEPSGATLSSTAAYGKKRTCRTLACMSATKGKADIVNP